MSDKLKPTVFHLWLHRRILEEGKINLDKFKMDDVQSIMSVYKIPKQLRRAIVIEMEHMGLISKLNTKTFTISEDNSNGEFTMLERKKNRIDNVSSVYRELGCFA